MTALSKLDMLIDGQIEMLGILRHIACTNRQCADGDLLEDVMPKRIDSVEEMDNFNQSLATDEYRKKLVMIKELTCNFFPLIIVSDCFC